MEEVNITFDQAEEIAQKVFYGHIEDVGFEVLLNKGKIWKDEALEMYASRCKKEKIKEFFYRLPLIGKMILKNSLNKYSNSKQIYLLIIYLMQDLKLKNLTEKNMEYIKENKTKVYDKYYREQYICDIFGEDVLEAIDKAKKRKAEQVEKYEI